MIDIEVDESYLIDNSVNIQLILNFPDDDIADITDDNIIADSFELSQSINDESELVIGGCIASQMKVQIVGITTDLSEKRIQVKIHQDYYSGNLHPEDDLMPADDLYPGLKVDSIEKAIFTGTVDSVTLQDNIIIKEIIAYDDLSKAENYLCGTYMQGLAQYSANTVTFKALIETITGHFLSEEIEDYSAIIFADKTIPLNYRATKEYCDNNITAYDVLRAVCEINACFATIDPEGKMKFVTLYQNDSTGGTSQKSATDISNYTSLSYENYETYALNLIMVPYSTVTQEDDGTYEINTEYYKYKYASTYSCYYFDNIITQCCDEGIKTILNLLYQKISDSVEKNYIFGSVYNYRPFSADILNRWWIETGDRVKIDTGYSELDYDDLEISTTDAIESVESFVFKKTITGITGMTVSVSAEGEQYIGTDKIDADS